MVSDRPATHLSGILLMKGSRKKSGRERVEQRGVGPRTILIDGYNVIKNTPGLARAEQVSQETGRESLLAQLRAKYRHTPHTVIVVFDGGGAVESTLAFTGLSRGRVVYTRRGETADAVIARLAAAEGELGREVVVVSDDGEVRQTAGGAGHATARVGDLARRMNEPDRYQRKQALHREHVRHQWESGGTGMHPRSGNPKRGPKRRRGPLSEPPL